mmetsp:Transcript_5901/g.13567  ORF Transcript_5901/g.13567 Transcript_5901/m.13567 type:complete len:505 (+) Transcript_5901:942-2456(+)
MRDGAEETRHFDAQWGIVPSHQDEGHAYTLLPEAEQVVREDEDCASREAARLAQLLPCYTPQHAGVELLHVFMLDLLGRTTPAAKVFREKFGEDFQSSGVVSNEKKVLAGLFLFCANAFCIYYAILKGFSKGLQWQYQFLFASLVQVVLDLILFETVECLWLNVMVPHTVHAQVLWAVGELRTTARRLADPLAGAGAHKGRGFFLNAPAHLFVAAKLAPALPRLLESMIVSSYCSHLPGQIAQTWPHSPQAPSDEDAGQWWAQGQQGQQGQSRQSQSLLAHPWRWLRGLSVAAVLLLQGATTLPYLYQRVILRIGQPLVVAVAMVTIYFIVQNVFVVAAVLGAMCLLVGKLLYDRRQRRRRRVSKVTATETVDLSVPGFGDSFRLDTTHRLSTFVEDALSEGGEGDSSGSSDTEEDVSAESDSRSSSDESADGITVGIAAAAVTAAATATSAAAATATAAAAAVVDDSDGWDVSDESEVSYDSISEESEGSEDSNYVSEDSEAT